MAAGAAPARYLALGDSYTIGEGVLRADRWPVQLAHALRAQGVALEDPQLIATTGWTTDELATGIAEAAPQGPFALVSLLIGVNNQYRGRPLEEYRVQFGQLLLQALDFADGDAARVLVLSIPDWGVTRFAAQQQRDPARIASEIDAFNAVAQEACTAHGVAFVDITPVSREHGADVRMLVDDGLHPSAAMYAHWTARALPIAHRSLS
ncbi:MAG: SGNH/GDSL hydrolase family protein [Pseudoxanthomonas sp.]